MLRSETEGDPNRRAAAITGLRAYQAAPRPAPPPAMPVLAQIGRARLLDYGTRGRPVLVVPSLINPSSIVDLLPELSMLRWLADAGLRPLLLDWGVPTVEDRNLDLAGHIETLLLPFMDVAGPDAAMMGYCLGGTMALAASIVRAPKALALIASPWRFSGFPDDARSGLAILWEQAGPAAEAMGLLPIEVLQTAFWRLDPRRTIDKFAAFGRTERSIDATRLFVAMEDWANDGAPLTFAVGRDLAETLFRDDATGRGEWRVADERIDPAALRCPVLDIVSTIDRIVPAASSVGIGRSLTLAQGHVGMVVGGRRIESLWRPLADWLADPHMSG